MRKWTILSSAVCLGMGLTHGALADVTVTVNVNKVKEKNVLEDIQKFKNVFLETVVDVDVERAAESEALINQRNNSNQNTNTSTEKSDTMLGSASNNEGILTVNQAAGNKNNQGSAISVSINAEGAVGFAETQAVVDQRNETNAVTSTLETNTATIGVGTADGSINGNAGIVGVNQAAGHENNQANAVSLAFSRSGGVALSEADLGQFTSGNTVTEAGVIKTATITGSVNNNTGIIGVNQSSGNMANQANVVSFAAAFTSPTPATP